jgi:hypothetical protein
MSTIPEGAQFFSNDHGGVYYREVGGGGAEFCRRGDNRWHTVATYNATDLRRWLAEGLVVEVTCGLAAHVPGVTVTLKEADPNAAMLARDGAPSMPIIHAPAFMVQMPKDNSGLLTVAPFGERGMWGAK